MKKFIGTHIGVEDAHALGLLAAAQGISKSAFIRSLIMKAIRAATKQKKEAA